MNKFIYLSLVMMQLTSCSFSSSQFDLIKNMISPENNSFKPEKNWNAYWMDRKIDLYAINAHDQIIFADEKINILYKDKQIYKITGLLPELQSLEIEANDNNLTYMLNKKILATDLCESWSVTIDKKTNFILHEQTCYAAGTDYNYTNSIFFNNESQIIALIYKIYPDYPPIQLTMDENPKLDLDR